MAINRVHSVLQIIDSGKPLEKNVTVLLLHVATELKQIPTTDTVLPEDEEAVREPVPALAPGPDILDQGQNSSA